MIQNPVCSVVENYPKFCMFNRCIWPKIQDFEQTHKESISSFTSVILRKQDACTSPLAKHLYFLARSQNCDYCDGFSSNLIFEHFSKICQENSRLIKVWQEQRVLYTKTNIRVWSYLAKFLLESDMFQTNL